MKKIFLNIVTLICIITIGISGYKIYTTLSDYKKADNVYSNIRQTKENMDNKNLSKEMSSINSDYKGWINVEGTNIDYPMVQGADNSFYLNHDFNKNYLPAGSIFIDYRNNLTTDSNTIVYGHHMRNSTMFGQIEKFKKQDFFDENKYITITNENKTYKYEIFAIGIYPSDFGYTEINFADSNDFDLFLQKIMGEALFTRNIVSSSDQIITLSTCSYEFDDARSAIFAKLIK
ncbi:MAG: class B sortase [Terrisporobacter sp.]|uniref:class B sortase n=1 Tax=Terrisporobacter sp. TaxID=1965305 RepID=UPI002FC630E4